MNPIQALQKDLKIENEITKKFIELYPDDKNDWKPHPKSMTLLELSNHIVDIFRWPAFMMQTEFLDLADSSKHQSTLYTTNELLEKLDENYAQSAAILKNVKMEDFDGHWQLKMQGNVLSDWTKFEAVMQAFKQITHHRAQLGVFYRLNDIPIPGSYGPSGDE